MDPSEFFKLCESDDNLRLVKETVELGLTVDSLGVSTTSLVYLIQFEYLWNELTPDLSFFRLNGEYAIHRAAEHGATLTVSFLLSRGCNITVKDFNGKTPLDRAMENNRKATELLLMARTPWRVRSSGSIVS